MSWRTVVISQRCKLDYKMGYMVIRGEETKRIYLDEIAIVIIENPAVSLTGVLLQTLTEKKIKVIFCTNKRSPYGELMPYYGSHDCSRKLKQQIAWAIDVKQVVWQAITREKILNQSRHLSDKGRQKEALLLESYIPQVEPGDKTNREGHAAKVYFNALFGLDFKRDDSSDPINSALDYGYAILLSAFNRAVCANGYSTELGIHHDNVFNFYNLSSDLMEPFRPLVDRVVSENEIAELTKEVKYKLVDVLNANVVIQGTNQTVLNAIDIYCRGVFNSLNEGDPGRLVFYNL